MQPVLYICTFICSIMSLSKTCEFESGTGELSAYEYNLVLHVLRKKNILALAGLFSYWQEDARLFADLLRFFVVTCRPSIFPIFEDFYCCWIF
jgi:hypothetical protein